MAAGVTLPSTANAANASTSPVVSQPVPGQTSPNCHDFTIPIMVEGQQRQASGQLCQQPDGSWRFTQNTPGLPPQVYTLPAQAIYVTPYPYEYYWADSWGFGPPIFAGGFFVVGGRICPVRHARFIHGGFHGTGFHGTGSHAGFHNGSHGGSHGGFHGGGHH